MFPKKETQKMKAGIHWLQQDTPHNTRYAKMIVACLETGDCQSFTDNVYWPPAERFGKARVSFARMTPLGVETRIENIVRSTRAFSLKIENGRAEGAAFYRTKFS